MNTRRCVYCQALQRADAQTCRRCGRLLPPLEKSASRNQSLPEAPVASRDAHAPQASPHYAGHSFGLHPEDQPYLSSMLPAQASLQDEQEHLSHMQPEPTRIVFPPTAEARAVKQARQQALRRSRATIRLQDEYVEGGQMLRSEHVQPLRFMHESKRTRINSLMLTFTCIFFLLATSIIAFVLIGKHTAHASASVEVVPDMVQAGETFRISGNGFAAHHTLSFSYDNRDLLVDGNGAPIHPQTDSNGSFMVLARVPANMTSGKHLLAVTDDATGTETTADLLVVAAQPTTPPAPTPTATTVVPTATATLSVPAAALIAAPASLNYTASTVTNPPDQSITLTNSSQQAASWSAQCTTDDGAAWLAVSPSADSIDAGKQETVTVSVNSLLLAPGSYHGQIVISGGAANLKIAVSLQIVTPGKLEVTPTALQFALSAGTPVAQQTVTVSNPGGSPLTWQAQAKTDDGASWLQLSASTGTLNAGAQTTLSVGIQGSDLVPQTYHGVITIISSGMVRVIDVHLTVVAPTATPVASPSPTPTTTPPVAPSATAVVAKEQGRAS